MKMIESGLDKELRKIYSFILFLGENQFNPQMFRLSPDPALKELPPPKKQTRQKETKSGKEMRFYQTINQTTNILLYPFKNVRINDHTFDLSST